MSQVKFHPLLNNLLIQLEPEPEQSTIIAVQKFTEGLARKGKVLSVGPEVRDVRVGQTVLASITAGVELSQGVVMVTERAVIGVQHE